MQVLIVGGDVGLASVWAGHLERQGTSVLHVQSEQDAIDAIEAVEFDVLVLNVVLEIGSAFAVADFASFRQPTARIIFVTNTTFFSDGSIFRHIPNTCAHIPGATPPEDLAALVEHYGMAQNG